MIRSEYRRHPFAGPAEITEHDDGLTVAEVLAALGQGPAVDVELVRFDAAGVPQAWPVEPSFFAGVRPSPGTVVRVRPRVRAAVVPLLATQLAAATGLSALAAQVIVGAAVAAVAFLASRLLIGTMNADANSREADRQNPTINGLQNVFATRGAPVPLVLGRVRMAPVRVATGYSQLNGQIVHRVERMTFGPGPVALHELKIGETPIHRFDGVKIQFRNVDEAETLARYPQLANVNCTFLANSATMGIYRDTIFEDVDGARLDYNVAEVRDTPAGTVAANVQFYFAGLVAIGDQNEKLSRKRQVGVYYRPASGGTWVTVSERVYTGKTTATLRFGVRIEFPSAGEWSIKVVRMSPDDDDVSVSDDSYLEAIQSELDGTMPSPANVAEIAFRIKATEQLSGTLDPINAVVQQMAPVWDGAAFGDPEPVRHPADIYIELLRAKYRRKAVADDRIALDAIKAWKDLYPDWRCDMVVASDKTLDVLVREVLATGLAIPSQIDGQHSVIHDRAGDPAVQVFTHRTTSDFSYQWNAPPEVHGFEIVFSSERAGWTDDELVVYANGYDAETATEIERLEPPGMALAKSDSVARIARWGYYHLAQVATRTTEVSFTCDLDHLACVRGDPVIFVGDALRTAIATGRLVDVTTSGGVVTALKLDDRPELTDGTQAHIMVRSSSGVIQYVTAVKTTPVEMVYETGNLISNGDFSSGLTGWLPGSFWADGGGYAVHSTTTPTNLEHLVTLEAGKIYEIVWEQDANWLAVYAGAGTVLLSAVNTAGSHTLIYTSAGHDRIRFRSNVNGGTVDNVSVREISYVTLPDYVWTVTGSSGVRVSPEGAFDDAEIAVGDLAVVYEYATEPQKWIVKEIAPDFGERARVTLMEATTVPLDDLDRPLPEYDPKVITANEPVGLVASIEYEAGQMYVALRWSTLDPAANLPYRVVLEDATAAVLAELETADRAVRFPVQSAFPETLTATVAGRQPTGFWGEGQVLAISTAAQFDAPASTSGFQGQVMGEVLYLTWDQAAANVSHHVIRYSPVTSGATWATSVPIVPTAQGEQANVPAQNGSYLIKPVTFQGAEAATAIVVAINSANGLPNAVETLALAPDFDGTGTGGVAVIGGELVFASDGVIADWETLASVANIFTDGRDSLTGSFTLADVIDLGAVDTARVTANVTANAYRPSFVIGDWASLADVVNLSGTSDGEWSVVVQVSTTEDDPAGSPTWSAWANLVVGDYRARAWRFRLVFAVTDPAMIVEVADFTVTVDMPDRQVWGENIAVGTSGVTVTFSPPFRAVPAIVVDAQGLPAGGRAVKSAVTAAGFTLNFVDSLGMSVAGTADYTAVGYGREGS